VTPLQWREIDAVVTAAMELPESEQDAWVARECAGRPELQAEVQSLLRAHRSAGVFLEPHTNEGRRVGPYRLVEPVGVGGMGSVYLAEREDRQFQQRVAIKLMGAGLEMRPEAVRRFLEERQILAGLAHPNIARLLDGGYTEEGTPYIVMEYIDGTPVTEYCEQHRLDVRARLRLFLQLTEGVRYAHQRLVIHRDIKPANILVTRDGIPKLLDFGVARLEDQDAGRTHTMVRALTPDYASPEQIRGEAITTASDVYSMGVLLYELLAGCRPYRFTSRQPHEIERVICEQEPEKPGVSSDLDNIVLMALRKDPQRRYGSVEQFAEDIRRFLEDRPVIARKDTLGYRSIKFVRRNRLGVLAATLIFVSLLVGIVGATWQAHRANQRESDNRRLLHAAQMSLAYSAWESSNVERVLTLLEAQRPKPGQPDLRSFGWNYLWRLSHGERFTLRHGTPLRAIAFSPDGRTLFTAPLGGTTRSWNVSTGQELLARPFARDKDPYKFASDGRTFALCGRGVQEVILLDVLTGRQVADITGFAGQLMSLGLSANGKTLAVGMRGPSVELWDVIARRRLRTLKVQDRAVSSVAFSPDGKWLASGGWDGDTVTLWDLSTGRQHATLTGHTGSVSSLQFSPDSKVLASASRDATTRLWDVAAKKELARLEGHLNQVHSLAFSPDGRLLATGGSGSVKLWNVATKEELATLRGHLLDVVDVAFSPDGGTLATAGVDATVKLWDVEQYLNPPALRGFAGPLNSVAFSPDGRLIATAGHELRIWDARSRKLRATLVGHDQRVVSVAWSHDGRTLASGGWDHTARLWDVASGRELAVLKGHGFREALEFTPDGATLAAGNMDGTIALWSVATHRELAALKADDPKAEVGAIAISPDGQRLAEGDSLWNVTLWDLAARRVLSSHKHLAGVNDLRFSPDGRILATGSWDRTVKLWDATTLRPIDSFQADANGVWCLAFSPDGRTLATGGVDRVVTLWDLATRQELAILRGHAEIVSSLAFSPDGMTLASTSYDRTVRLWQAGSGQ